MSFDMLAWLIAPSEGQAGFAPHRDRQPSDVRGSFHPDGSPKYCTAWSVLLLTVAPPDPSPKPSPKPSPSPNPHQGRAWRRRRRDLVPLPDPSRRRPGLRRGRRRHRGASLWRLEASPSFLASILLHPARLPHATRTPILTLTHTLTLIHRTFTFTPNPTLTRAPRTLWWRCCAPTAPCSRSARAPSPRAARSSSRTA